MRTENLSNYDVIEQSIIDELLLFLKQEGDAGRPFNRINWTRGVKERLCILGHKYGYDICARECSGANFGEWLYDMCWSKNDGDFLTQIGLVLECGWAGWDLDPDFQKLIQARADHRVWIFGWYGNEDNIQNLFQRCTNQVINFQGTQKGDRYLLVGLLTNTMQIYSWLYIH